MSWYHSVGGTYHIEDQWLGVDFARLFLEDRNISDSVFIHEYVHSILAHSDYSQGTRNIFQLAKHFDKLNDADVDKIKSLLYKNQWFCQEGYASYMQTRFLMLKIGKEPALDWAKKTFHPDYVAALEEFEFVFDIPKKKQNLFQQKIANIALETNLREAVVKNDLLTSVDNLESYLNDEDNNPDIRMRKLIAAVHDDVDIVELELEDLTSKASVKFFPVSEKSVLADFLSYVSRQTATPHEFSESDIGDAPADEDKIHSALDNMLVTNLNLNLAETAEFLFDINDLVHYADVLDILFLNLQDGELPYKEVFDILSGGRKPEISIIGVTKTGEKYLTLCSLEEAKSLLQNELSHVTSVVKWGGYNLEENCYVWSEPDLSPKIVLYNRPNDMVVNAKKYAESKNGKMSKLHIQAAEDSAIQMLLLKEMDTGVLHISMNYGDSRIVKALESMGETVESMDIENIREDASDINSLLYMLNLSREVNWVLTMIEDEVVRA